jgi:organic hydroperoxide reductase OsmC/OhrA
VRTQRIYNVTVHWTGNRGPGTSTYDGYARDHTIRAGSKPDIPGSSDPAFRGDHGRWNPEELLVAAVSACHKLWYLHLCADAGIAVLSYRDDAEGTMVEDEAGGKLTHVILRPQVTVRPGDDTERAKRLHYDAHTRCNIARSVNFPIECDPDIVAAQR